MPRSDAYPPRGLSVSTLPQNHPHLFDIAPGAEARAALAAELGLSALRKLRFTGEIRSAGKRDWVLEADLGATVVQPCVQTLKPVTTRIDTAVRRRFVTDWKPEGDAGSETEMPEDDSIEPLGAFIDPEAVMAEALALAVPDYPRSTDAEPLGETVVTEPGKEALKDEDLKPFAGLAALREKIGKPEPED